MALKNAELLERAESAFQRVGVKKTATVPTTASLATGDFMNRAQVERLVDLTVGQSDWLSACSLRMRSQRAGEIPRIVISEVVTEGVDENAGATIATHPGTDNVPYNAGKFQATWYLTLEDLREAAATGEVDFDSKVRKAFAKAMGNDLARAAMNGDEDLGTGSRLNRLLRKRDGWLKKIRATGNRATTTLGSAFARGVFPALLDMLPEEFLDDPGLRWFMSSKVDLDWTDTLAGLGASVGSALGDRALTERERHKPYGIPQLLIPQIPTSEGFARLIGTTAAADTIADDGDGTLTATVSTMLGGAAAGNAGRKVKILCSATGQSETLTVLWTGAANTLESAGSLGQSTISTTAADYVLDLADITPILCTNPLNLCLVLCDKIRAYRKWQQEFERWRIDVFYDADFVLFNEDATALQDGVILPSFSFGA